MPPPSELEGRLLGWSVPSDVREAVHRALAVVTREGATLIEATVGDQVAIAVRDQPVALYISPSRVSAALDPAAAERAHRADSAIGLDKSSESTWIVHCRYGRLDSARLNSMTALMITALRRYAPRPEPRATPTKRRRAPARTTPTRTPTVSRQSEEERRRVVDAAVPRCPVPGCNLPMVGGSCGFHD
ncbi:MAG TPA: hypothetical protein VM428_02620 [Microlunatus sp.]|nr:hypothetical protein [Microlunatus sp.]